MWQLTGFRGYGKPKVQPPVKELIKKKKKELIKPTQPPLLPLVFLLVTILTTPKMIKFLIFT